MDGSKIYGIGSDVNLKSESILNWQTISPLYYNMNSGKYRLYNNTGTDIVFDKPEAKLAELFEFLSSAQTFGSSNVKSVNWNNTGMWLQYGDEQKTTNKEIGIANIPVKQQGDTSYSTFKNKNIMIFKSDKNREDVACSGLSVIPYRSPPLSKKSNKRIEKFEGSNAFL